MVSEEVLVGVSVFIDIEKPYGVRQVPLHFRRGPKARTMPFGLYQRKIDHRTPNEQLVKIDREIEAICRCNRLL